MLQVGLKISSVPNPTAATTATAARQSWDNQGFFEHHAFWNLTHSDLQSAAEPTYLPIKIIKPILNWDIWKIYFPIKRSYICSLVLYLYLSYYTTLESPYRE